MSRPTGKRSLSASFKALFISKQENPMPEDALTELAKLEGVSEVVFLTGSALQSITVPTRFAALAKHLIEHGQEAVGVFHISGNSKTINILREHFTAQMFKEPTTETMVVAANLPDNVPYDVHDVADTFKSFIHDLSGGILGEVELFNSLRKNLPNLQLTNSDLSLDFGCIGPKDTTNPKRIAQILRNVSDKERLNFILLVFGVMASVRVTYHSPCSSNTVATQSSSNSTGPYAQQSGTLSNKPSGQPILRTRKSTSNIKRPRVSTDSSTHSPTPVKPRIRATKSFWNLGNRSTDVRSASTLNASMDHTPVTFIADFQTHSTEFKNSAGESSNHAHKLDGTISTPTKTIPCSPPDSPKSPQPPREDVMTSKALGKIFAPLLLGDKLDAIELLTSNRSSTMSNASSSTDDSGSHYNGSPIDQRLPQYAGKGKAKVGSVPDPVASTVPQTGDATQKAGGKGKEKMFSPMRWLKNKKEADGKMFDEAQQRLKLAAWVVECLVKNWENIAAEYVKGLEGVDAQVECMTAYY